MSFQRKIYFDIKSLKDIIADKSVLFITSKSTLKYCQNFGDKIISNIKSHPNFDDLELIYKQIHANEKYDIIVALGGGSVIDAAKFLSVLPKNNENTDNFVSNLIKNNIQKDYTLIPIIATPTTAGTGSELTPWATIWDKKEAKKYSLSLPDLYPDFVIYEPKLTLTLPLEITKQSALDALSHALESIWNKNANPISTHNAIKACEMIMKYLPKLAKKPNNLKFRRKIMQASMFAALAFSITQTSIAHAMSYYITAHKGVPHGIACSFTLPMIAKIAIKNKNLAKILKKALGKNVVENLENLFKTLNIKTNFSDYINKSEFHKLINTLNQTNRIKNSVIDIKEIKYK